MIKNFNWVDKGFLEAPSIVNAPLDGLTMYRAWGGGSSEWGSGFFSLEKPESVLDAELRFNIVEWGNHVHFVSTFWLKPGYRYRIGRVGKWGSQDIYKEAHQIFLETPFAHQIEKIGSFEVLKHDAFVSPRVSDDMPIVRGRT